MDRKCGNTLNNKEKVMCEAKRRGAFEERKAQALKAGRVKTRRASYKFGKNYSLLELMASLFKR